MQPIQKSTTNKTILINNSNKKFICIDTFKNYDETEFINEIRNHIKNKKFYLFGCDFTVITKIYASLLGEFVNQKDDFVLVTGETTFILKQSSILHCCSKTAIMFSFSIYY